MEEQHLTRSLGLLNLETNAVPSLDQSNQLDNADNASDDAWCDDGLMGETSDADAELNREQKRRHDHFYTMGYRDGVSAGKEASAQEGFNIGFKQSAPNGYKWGLVRGITSAFAGLPDDSKEKLVEKIEDRDRFYSLYESAQEISADDALKLYYCQLLKNSQSDQKSEEDLDCNKLDLLFKDLTSLVSEASEIKVSVELAKADLNV